MEQWISKYLPFLLLIFVVVFHAVLLFPELTELSPDLNDNVFHYSLCVSMNEEFDTGGNPIDHWVPYWTIGFPVFHHYQHLPHLAVVLVYRLFYERIPLLVIFRLFNYFLLVLYPLALYYGLRRLRFSRLAAAFAALLSLSLSNLNGYGFELGSFIFRGSGMFTQLWAMFLFPFVLASIYKTLDENKNYFQSVIFLFMISVSQVMFGLAAALTSLLFLFLDFKPAPIGERTKRLLLIFGFFLLISAYFFIPMMIDSPYHAHSTYDFPEKWNSYGARYVITQFLNGGILDSGRLAVLTILAPIGLFFALSRKAFRYRLAALGFIFWLLIYFGRPTWGKLFDLMPLSSALHLHRFVTMVHFFSAILAGIALSVIFRIVKRKFKIIMALAVTVILVCPVFWDRFIFMKFNTEWLRSNKADYQKESRNFESVQDYIKRLPPGRVYPGRRANWGGNFKIGQTAVLLFLGAQKIPALSFLPYSWALAGDFSENFNEYDWSHFNLFNIKYILSDVQRDLLPYAKELFRAGRFRVSEGPTTGYFDLVESPIAVYGDKNSIWNLMILWMRSPLVAHKQYVSIFFDRDFHPGYQDYLLMKDRWEFWKLVAPQKAASRLAVPSGRPINIFAAQDPLGIEQYRFASPGFVLTEEAGKNSFSCKVMAEKDCFLLFKMTYHPGWRAYDDGKELKTIIMSPGLTGIKIKKGEHSVKFIYRAQEWKTLLLFVGLMSGLALFVWDRKRR